MTPCRLVSSRRNFRGACCPRLLGSPRLVSWGKKWDKYLTYVIHQILCPNFLFLGHLNPEKKKRQAPLKRRWLFTKRHGVKTYRTGFCSLHNTRGELSYLAPLGSENISAPYFKQCFFQGERVLPPPSPRLSQTPRHPVPRRDTREKEIVIWPCWCFHGRYYFYSLKFTLMFINERKRNANTYLISNFDSLEAAPSNLPP